MKKSSKDEGYQSQEISDYIKTFSTSHGRRVLDHIERRAYSAFRLDQQPTAEKPNPAYMNKDAALYRSGQIDIVKRIRRMLDTYGPKINYTTDTIVKNIEEEN